MSCLGDSSSSVTKALRNLSWSRSPQGLAAVNIEVNAMYSAAAHMRTEFIPGHVLRSSHLLPQNSISTSENKHWEWEVDGSPIRGRTVTVASAKILVTAGHCACTGCMPLKASRHGDFHVLHSLLNRRKLQSGETIYLRERRMKPASIRDASERCPLVFSEDVGS